MLSEKQPEINYIEELKNICGTVLLNEPMSLHTSFRTGGPAEVFIKAESTENIIGAIDIAKKYNKQYIITGNGSNILVKDGGIDGIVINIGNEMSKIKCDGTKIYAQAGAMLSALATAAADEELTGLEFASGIPGTVGGAVFMNAGAYDGEIKDVIEYADVIDSEGNTHRLIKDELELSYRHSVIAEKNMIVVGAMFNLNKGIKKDITDKMADFAKRRRDKQPLNYPSAGSTFKRPEGYFAGKLIEDSGLKGKTVGGAQVSEKHAGFVVNIGNATSSDIIALMDGCIETVYNKFGVKLEPEVRILGKDL